MLSTEGAALTFHTLVFLALVTGSSYAGTSVLFAAYLAGASSTWWDSLCLEHRRANQTSHPPAEAAASASKVESKAKSSPSSDIELHQRSESERLDPQKRVPSGIVQSGEITQSKPSPADDGRLPGSTFISGAQIFEKFYHPALKFILKPFFFASIGFSIPISRMFLGTVVWKGIVYSILMVFGKLLCGLCLLRFDRPTRMSNVLRQYLPSSVSACWSISNRRKTIKSSQTSAQRVQDDNTQRLTKSPRHKAPISLYPAALLGSAMVARGEIGFLISSVAESDGVLGPTSDGSSSELFLVVTWAILLCTLIGPITVGLMVKRVRRLQAIERSQRTGKADPLGAWGVATTK